MLSSIYFQKFIEANTTPAERVQHVIKSVNQSCQRKGGVYASYSCKTVSWDDVTRHTNSTGEVSCWGNNITDTYLKSKDGVRLFTIRPDNWNEKLGIITASDLAVVAGNTLPTYPQTVSPMTLTDLLRKIGQHGSYANLDPSTNLSHQELDKKVSIRFQTTFLPLPDGEKTFEFATESYNYNTRSDNDPKNLLLLCTTQGISIDQDGRGTRRLFAHTIGGDKSVTRHWLEAEQTRHEVGGAQHETATERADAIRRGKATACVIGTKAMGTRLNVLMTIQVPLKQQTPVQQRGSSGEYVLQSMTMNCSNHPKGNTDDVMLGGFDSDDECGSFYGGAGSLMAHQKHDPLEREPKGASNAARVSSGSKFDDWRGLDITKPERHPSEHITVTCVLYYTVANGVPTTEDVVAAIDDMETLYAACGQERHGQLSEKPFAFMKTQASSANDTTPTPGPTNYTTFPSDKTEEARRCVIA